MLWEALSKIALLGTDRTAISPELLQQLQTLGIPPDMDPAMMVIKAAAILQAQRKAGLITPKWTDQIPSMDFSKTEMHASSRSSRHLQLILDDTHAAALEEFLQLMHTSGKTIAPLFIPILLELALTDGAIRGFILPLIGERGKWLVGQNPKWAVHFAPAQLDSWETASLEERLFIFHQLRINQPQEALALLTKDWAELESKNKGAFLSKMQTGLSNSDESFLEDCLYETRKEIRQLAANLLARLPNSALSQRMWERIQDFVQIKKNQLKKEQAIITLPDNIDETMLRDGIDPRHQWKSGGLKASRLGQMIAVVPPKRWEKEFSKKPVELIQLFLQSDWAVLFLQAFSQAAILHQDQEWMEAILSLWIKNKMDQRWQDFPVRSLLEAIDADVFDRVCQLALKVDSNFSDEQAPLIILIRHSKHLWSPTFSKNLIRAFQRWMAQQNHHHWGGWHYKTVLDKAAYHSAIDVQDSLRKNWPTDAPLWSAWQQDIERFFSTLQFRYEMKLELTAENT